MDVPEEDDGSLLLLISEAGWAAVDERDGVNQTVPVVRYLAGFAHVS